MNQLPLNNIPNGTYVVATEWIAEIRGGVIVSLTDQSGIDLTAAQEFEYFGNEKAWNDLAAIFFSDLTLEQIEDNVSFGVLCDRAEN